MIAVSGTPGTGKSVFARALAKRLGSRIVDLGALIAENKIFTTDANGTKIVNLSKMKRVFARAIKGFCGPIIVEGLLAHLLQKELISHVVVLRTRPKVLERRLRARGYPKEKTRQNIEAEALDIILWEAVNAHGIGKVYEIDTTRLRPGAAADLFLKALEGKISLRPGKISWLAEVF